jgi:hypothetical protein
MRLPSFTPGRLLVLIYVKRLSRPQARSVAEGLGQLKFQRPHWDSNQQPSGLQHKASFNYGISCPKFVELYNQN